MEVLIFILYLFVCFFSLQVIPFYKNSGIKVLLAGILAVKVLAGFTYAWYYKLPQNFANADTWRFFMLSLAEKDALLNNPAAFIRDLFSHGYSNAGGLFAGEDSYWNDLKSNLFVKMLAVANVLTNSSYYTNIVLFNFLFLAGQVGLFKSFQALYPSKKYLLIALIFFLPSTLFWCSGIHKDGLILSALGLIVYSFDKSLKSRRFLMLPVFTLLLCFVLIFFLRSYIAFALVPALLCWAICYNRPKEKIWVFSLVYSIGIILFFSLTHISPSLNLAGFIVEKKHEFLQLKGSSFVSQAALEPTFFSFVKFLPFALDMAFFRPHLFESDNLAYLPAAFEVLLITGLIIFSILFGRESQPSSSFVWFSMFFSITVLLIAGYTIPFYGAVVRYRSLVLPFFCIPMVVRLTFTARLKR